MSDVKTILLVEDEALVRGSMVQFMEVVGYRVVEAVDGASALAVDLGSVDLAVLDLGLPDMGGDDLYAILMERRPGLPVLFLSGDSVADLPGEVDRERCFIAKPVDPSEIIARLADLLS